MHLIRWSQYLRNTVVVVNMVLCVRCYNEKDTNVHLEQIWVAEQAQGQDGWILAKFFFCFINREEVEVHENAKKKKNKASIQPS